MSNIRIVYPLNGGVAVMQPVDDGGLSPIDFAKRQVPLGLPFRIIAVSDLPASDDQRESWHIDEAEYSDGVGERVEVTS